MKTICIAAFGMTTFALASSAAAYTMDDRDIRKAEPVAGRDRATPFKPSWCRSVQPMGGSPGGLGRTAASVVENGSSDVATLSDLARYLCDSPDDPGVQKQAGYVIQKWMNWTGLGQAEATAAFAARADLDAWKRMKDETCASYTSGGEDSAEKTTLDAAHRAFFGCDAIGPLWDERTRVDNLVWYLDRASDPPSELLRVAMVLMFLPPSIKPEDQLLYPLSLRGYLIAGIDGARIDAARLERELEGANVYARTIARENLARAKADVRSWQAHIDAATAKDPDLKKLLVDMPARAWSDWETLRAREAAVFEEGEAFERDANAANLSAVKGCAAKLRPTLSRLLKALKPADAGAVPEAIKTDPVAAPAFERYVLCLAMENEYPAAQKIGREFRYSRGYRGPRMAVYHAAVETLGAILADRPKFVMQPNHLRAPAEDPIPARSYALYKQASWFLDLEGVVAATKKVEGGLYVTFKKESYRKQEWDCTPTKKIYRINSSGVIEYVNNCKPAGTSEVETTARPVVIPDWLAGGIAPGRFLACELDNTHKSPVPDVFVGVPWAVYENKAQTKLLAIWGIEVDR